MFSGGHVTHVSSRNDRAGAFQSRPTARFREKSKCCDIKYLSMFCCTVAIGRDLDICQAFVVNENQFHVQFNGLDLHINLIILVNPAPGNGRIVFKILEKEIFLLDGFRIEFLQK